MEPFPYKNEENDNPFQTSSYYGDQITKDSTLLEIDLSTPVSPTSIQFADIKPRGIEISDEHDPKQWSKTNKSLVLVFNCFGVMLVGLSNSIFYPVIPLIRDELGFTNEVANIIVAIYLCIVGIAQLGWAAYSDDYGTRRRVSLWMLLITRVFQACGISAVLCISAGIINDMYIPTERGFAYGILFSGYLTGHMIGPIIGGLIGFNIGWRWIFCLCSVLSLALLLFTYSLPETFYTPLPSTSTNHPLSHSFDGVPSSSKSKKSPRFFNPLSPLSLFRYPNNTLIIFGMIGFSLISYLQDFLLLNTFVAQRGTLSDESIIIFLVISLGCIAGSLIGGMHSDLKLRKSKSPNDDEIF
ncbi:11085_t:CDS:2, partial [Acaulospora morrowiae]